VAGVQQSFLEFLVADVLLNGAIYAFFVVPAYLVFWVGWAGRWRHRRIQARPRANARSLRHDIAFSLVSLGMFAGVDLGIALLEARGLTRLYGDIDAYGVAWFVASIPAVILLHDAYFYWMHRAMHHPALYRRVHRVHHRSTDPSPFTSFAFHPLEAIVENGFTLLAALVLPLHFAALLAWQLFQQLFNMIGHLGYEVYPAWWLRAPGLRWKTASTHHNLHHQHFVGNYGLYFTWWDLWCGTELPQYAERFAQVTARREDRP
jgi:sterol desaturase/sphingolipid hydroxylase (fatty acid hydroxylase superfamily)